MLDYASFQKEGERPTDAMSVFEDEFCSCFAVAEGKQTKAAAELVVQTMVEVFRAQGDITANSLPAMFDAAQEKLTEKPELGSVSAAVLLTDGKLALWAHIGDCRIYHLQDGWLYDITPDHSDAYLRYEAGDMRYPKIRGDKLRKNLFHLMGAEQDFHPEYSAPTMLREKDSLMLCTQGFWMQIPERKIEHALKHSKSAKVWMSRMTKRAIRNRNRRKFTREKADMTAVTVKI